MSGLNGEEGQPEPSLPQNFLEHMQPLAAVQGFESDLARPIEVRTKAEAKD